ncbi:BQ5605_C031g10937 [Microbotryum silenes-dioicae]|uniref:BQ5605_C031g10937 protein n=1 Tax=Microbotryum silenes-dioicae TaxID=796604 RepID=A0A2X0N3P2_9BASI|nr:BQ5605_C031g10937 [Microbotryum silenes-dioicae]
MDCDSHQFGLRRRKEIWYMKRYRGRITQLLWFYRTLYAHPVTSSGSDWMIWTKGIANKYHFCNMGK